MPRTVSLSAIHNVDSNMITVQLFIEENGFFHPEDLQDAIIQLVNKYNLPDSGPQEVLLEKVQFNKDLSNKDRFFRVFFMNPSRTSNLEVRAQMSIAGMGAVQAKSAVLKEEGTFTDSPNTSAINLPNRHQHLDPEPERSENPSPHEIKPLSEEQIIEVPSLVYEDIKFEQLAEIKDAAVLNGTLIYLGGGNRLLPVLGKLAKQTIDTPPWEIGAATFVEQEAAQLLGNNTFTTLTTNLSDSRPTGYVVNSPSVIADNRIQQLQVEGASANVWTVRMRGSVPADISPFSEVSIGLEHSVAFDATKPLAFSVLVGLQKNTADTSITVARLRLTFSDFADRELTSLVRNLDVDDLLNARPLRPFNIEVPDLSMYPPTAERVLWRLEIGSIEQGDFVTTSLALPNLTQTHFPGSTVLSGGTRAKDNLALALSQPTKLIEGACVVSMAVGWENSPRRKRVLLDSRDNIGVNNGFVLHVSNTGNLTLEIHGSSSMVSLATTTPPDWNFGEIVEIVAEWSASLLRLLLNGAVVAENTSATLPPNIQNTTFDSVQIGSDVQINSQADSEFVRVVLLRRPR